MTDEVFDARRAEPRRRPSTRLREGLEAWRGESCGCGAVALGTEDHGGGDAWCGTGACTDGCCDRTANATQTAAAPESGTQRLPIENKSRDDRA